MHATLKTHISVGCDSNSFHQLHDASYLVVPHNARSCATVSRVFVESKRAVVTPVSANATKNLRHQVFRRMAIPKPSITSRRNVVVASAEKSDEDTNLLVVGPGVLGSLVGSKWLQKFPSARVVGQTNTDSKHAELVKMGFHPRLKAEAGGDQFANVIFCAPPSGSDDYTAEIAAAAESWSGRGAFVFTSSSAVYPEQQGVVYTEDSEVVARGASERVDRLLDAENVVLSRGGSVVRLAGLYHAGRGAHTYYLKMGQVPVNGSALLNLIHYQDAASLCVAALASGGKGEVFMGCDNNPLSKADMMQSVLASKKYGETEVTFTGNGGPMGRIMSNNTTRAKLSWQPQYASFQEFMVEYAAGNTPYDNYMQGSDHVA